MSIIAIPEPKSPSTKIAKILFQDKCKIEVYWWNETRQIIVNIQDSESVWFLLRDGNILETISIFMCCYPSQILMTDVVVYDDQTMNLCRIDDDDAQLRIYECKWSDYANDNMMFSCNAFIYKQATTIQECQKLSLELSKKMLNKTVDTFLEQVKQIQKEIQENCHILSQPRKG